VIPPVMLPITPAEFRRDSAELTRLEDTVAREIGEAHRALAETEIELREGRVEAWKTANGKTRDERIAQVEAAVSQQKARAIDLEGRIAKAKTFSFALGHRSQRLIADQRFATRQMELDTPEPDRAPHRERT
jgi:hypothetical protein